MSDYPFLIPRPFTEGYVSDIPVEFLGGRMAARLDNWVQPRGLVERRRGWKFDGTTADDSAGTTEGVIRNAFRRGAVTRNFVTLTNGAAAKILIHNATAVGTLIADANIFGISPTPVVLPRCVWRDEVIFCAQDGITPLVRVGTTSLVMTGAGVNASIAAGERRFTWVAGTTLPADQIGAFFRMTLQTTVAANRGPVLHPRISVGKSGSIEVTVDGVRATAAFNDGAFPVIRPYGWSAPVIPAYNAGTLTFAGTTATGQGTLWATNNNALVAPDIGTASDALVDLQAVGTTSWLSAVVTLASDTSLTNIVRPAVAAATSYALLRRMPFTDVAAWRRCLFGIGVRDRANTLWYTAPNADIALYPRNWAGVDFDPSVALNSLDPTTDFMMLFVEVPTFYDADPNIALLPTSTALYIPKREAVYRITGDYPNFQSDKVHAAAGCLDIRSAISDENGVFWCGVEGVWTVRGGQLVNLTIGANGAGINREWRALMNEGITGPTAASTSWIACGVSEGHLIVSVKTAIGTTRCFVYDLARGVWCGKFTNATPRFMWSSSLPGETELLLGAQDANARRVIDYSPMFRTPAGLYATPGGINDDDGVTPLGVAHTGSRVFFPQSESNEGRLTDLKLTVKAYDTATPSTTITPTIVHGDGYDATVDTTTGLAGFDADTTNVAHTKIYRPGTRGRRQQLQIVQTDQDAEFSSLEIHELAGTVRTYSRRR